MKTLKLLFMLSRLFGKPEELIDYARKAYFGAVGDDRTAYPGIRDRLTCVYEQVLIEQSAWSLELENQQLTVVCSH